MITQNFPAMVLGQWFARTRKMIFRPRHFASFGLPPMETTICYFHRILAYIMSFIIIGLYWVIHHNSMHAMKITDRGFHWRKAK